MIDNLQLKAKKKDTRSLNIKEIIPLYVNRNHLVELSPSILERKLISGLKAGEISAFTFIFSAYYKDLVIFAARFTKDLSSAEDIVQGIFVQLWEDHESSNINSSIKSYLLRTANNKCIDWYRHNKAVKAHTDFVLETSIYYEYDTENYVLHSELEGRIEAALDLLPEEVSVVFRMNRFKGLKYQEIAELLNVSVRTIEVRIGKALNLLRNQLKEYFPAIIWIIIATHSFFH